jgi:hypothetical protein
MGRIINSRLPIGNCPELPGEEKIKKLTLEIVKVRFPFPGLGFLLPIIYKMLENGD